MAENTSTRNRIITIVVLILLLLLLLLLLRRCTQKVPAAAPGPVTGATPAAPAQPPGPAVAPIATPEPPEMLTPATVTAPEKVDAGAVFQVSWTGPANHKDYLTIVKQDAPASASGQYRETKDGPTLEFTAPIEPGSYEVRYGAGRSHTVLGRAVVTVVPVGATLDASVEVVLGAKISVTWKGPDNKGDFITLVPKETPDEKYGNYTYTKDGSPLDVTAPTVAGDGELRYMSGQGNKVLGRRAIRIVMPDVSLAAPTEAVEGATIQVTWTGPNNPGDFVTVVAPGTKDGEYGNYGYTRSGSPLPLLMPIMVGDAELRYMTGQGYKVLARRPLRLLVAEVTLSAPDTAVAGAPVSITWTGPAYPGDYLTIVAQSAADGQYGHYTNARGAATLTVNAPKTAGDGEIRYMTGQGGKVLGRRPIRIMP